MNSFVDDAYFQYLLCTDEAKMAETVRPTVVKPKAGNGVHSLKWRLTDRYLRWGGTRTPAAGLGRGRSVQIE